MRYFTTLQSPESADGGTVAVRIETCSNGIANGCAEIIQVGVEGPDDNGEIVDGVNGGHAFVAIADHSVSVGITGKFESQFHGCCRFGF